jgi:hypothetical protein
MTLQVVMNQIIERDDFLLGHIGKERLERLGELPLRLDVHEEAAHCDALLAEDGDDKNSENNSDKNDRNCNF